MLRSMFCSMFVLFVLVGVAVSQTNYDESKVPEYSLPDPMVLADGQRVANRASWNERSGCGSAACTGSWRFRDTTANCSPNWSPGRTARSTRSRRETRGARSSGSGSWTATGRSSSTAGSSTATANEPSPIGAIVATPYRSARRSNAVKTSLSNSTASSGLSRAESGVKPTMSAKKSERSSWRSAMIFSKSWKSCRPSSTSDPRDRTRFPSPSRTTVPAAVAGWLAILERLYAVFRLAPFGAPRIRAVKQAQKHYHFDWSVVPDDGPRFENLVAGHLLKWVHHQQDTQGREVELRYFLSPRLKMALPARHPMLQVLDRAAGAGTCREAGSRRGA